MKKEEVEVLAKHLKATIVETHISWVLLSGQFAYKIKKPLKTSFLDFSTLSKRKKFCFIEIELNQMLAPKIYLEVVGIKKTEIGFLIVPVHEKPIDFAVKMRRLDSARQMDLLLANDKVDEKDIKILAKKIAHFHSLSRRIRKNKKLEKRLCEFNDLLSLKNKIIENYGLDYFRQIEATVKYVNKFLKKNAALFVDRTKGGFKRDCHGDLHSGNIFLYKDPVLFDRIEFNREFRQIDVLHELGFLCMDLELYGKKKLSELCLKSYLKYSGMEYSFNEQMLFNYYKCYTAGVRAKVNLMSSGKTNFKNRQKVKKYLNIMRWYSQTLE